MKKETVKIFRRLFKSSVEILKWRLMYQENWPLSAEARSSQFIIEQKSGTNGVREYRVIGEACNEPTFQIS